MPDELENVKRLLQEQSLLIQRLGFEVEASARENRPVQDGFYQFVTHPVDGLVVKHRHLERTVAELDKNLANVIAEMDANAKERKERKRWVLREVLALGGVLIVTAVLASVITVKLAGG